MGTNSRRIDCYLRSDAERPQILKSREPSKELGSGMNAGGVN